MGSINVRKGNQCLYIDFRFRGIRCREQTTLPDTPENRRKLAKVLERIENDIARDAFNYRQYFPKSPLAARFDSGPVTAAGMQIAVLSGPQTNAPGNGTPLFADFSATWFGELEVGWRRTYRRTVRDILDKHLLPEFGEKGVGRVTKAELLQFRSTLAKVRGRNPGKTLSPARINTIMMILRAILNEAADRFDFSTPCRGIKPLKNPRSDVDPFTLEEVRLILERVRPDFRNYYTVRFFTGMRTGEIDGLKWKYVDFERKLILVRETVVDGETDTTKTQSSQRDIQMSDLTLEAMKRQQAGTGKLGEYVFCNRQGQPLEHNNVTKRVWYPLLRHLGLRKRRPYQTRHTAATLWLAAGENPEWIARQLGHSSTQMLFTVYSRFVPNLTRRDGSAFERLVAGTFGGVSAVPSNDPFPNVGSGDKVKETGGKA